MEWKEEKTETVRTSLIFEKDGVVAEIEDGYVDEKGNPIVNLNISKKLTYGYGQSNAVLNSITGSGSASSTSVDKQVTLTTWYNELFSTVDEAKAKAEELLPLFESIG